MNSIKYITILIITLFLCSCKPEQIRFQKDKWLVRDIDYLYRKNMIDDLMENYLEVGMSCDEIINLLGKPMNLMQPKENTYTYSVDVDYGWDIDPVEGSDLIIEFNNDSVVTKYELVNWKH